jgi:hypothetical protein
VTAFTVSTVTVQPPEPVQAPLQPANEEPASGIAVRVTTVLLPKLATQADPQLMPPEEAVTVPLPLPVFVTVNTGDAVNVAIIVGVDVLGSLVITRGFCMEEVGTQGPAVREHNTASNWFTHPENTDPGFGKAVSVTLLPSGKAFEHMMPQSIPNGLLITLPAPVPFF